MSVFVVILVHIFPAFYRLQTEYGEIRSRWTRITRIMIPLSKQTWSQNSHWEIDFFVDGIFLVHVFISKFNSSSFWSTSASVTAIITWKSFLHRKLFLPESIYFSFLRSGLTFWNYYFPFLWLGSDTLFKSHLEKICPL